MDFWVACEDYKKISPSKRASRARQIYQQYVEADAPREVMTDGNSGNKPEMNLKEPKKNREQDRTESKPEEHLKGMPVNPINATAHSPAMKWTLEADYDCTAMNTAPD